MESSCSECYVTSFSSCYGWFLLDLGLTPNTSYFIWVIDKFDRRYTIEVTTDADGNFQVPTSDFPEGLFIASAGNFRLYISTSETENTEEAFTIGYTEYSCVLFNLYSEIEI